MSLIKITPIEQLKSIFTKILLSRTDKVTKISENSVLNGIVYANAKIAQKTLKDIAIIQSRNLPGFATGVYLDDILSDRGLPARQGAEGSYTHIRFEAENGTTYNSGSIISGGDTSVQFELMQDVIVSQNFAYGLAKSTSNGAETNISPLVLDTVNPQPNGHLFLTNEYRARGGRDSESDQDVFLRIKNHMNLAATGTLAKIEQVLINTNSKVLKVFNEGLNINGKLVLKVLSVNGVDFTESEFDDMMENAIQFLSMSEINFDYLTNNGIKLENVEWFNIDIGFRCSITGDVSLVRNRIQVRLNKYFDYRDWELNQRVEWDDLLQIVKNTNGVEYVADNTFVPSADIEVPFNKLPRVRGFELRDLNGQIIYSETENLDPIYYPQNKEFFFIKTFLRTL